MKIDKKTIAALLIGSGLYEKYFNININYIYEKILFPIAFIESGFDNNAISSSGKHKGLFQFGSAAGSEVGHYKKIDPIASSIAFVKYAKNGIQDSGVNPNSPFDVYLLHQQGATGYKRFKNKLLTNPTAKITEAELLNNLPTAKTKTYNQFKSDWIIKLNNNSASNHGLSFDTEVVSKIWEELNRLEILKLINQ